MTDRKIASREESQAARDELLRREKEHTRMGDELARQRRELPWVAVDKEYRFETDEGTRSLAELFDGRAQLLVYHFMFGPSYEAGCPTCSSIADTIDAVLPHVQARGVTMLCVSCASLENLQAYKRKMGWTFPWASSADSEFNFDFGVSYTDEQLPSIWGSLLEGELPPILRQMAATTGTDVTGYVSEGPGLSAFALADGAVYHTYSTQARGCEFLMPYYSILDRSPQGRDEGDSPQMWLRRHDEYGPEELR
jgi:predicted dithiol-disulfide oxidoreductase (DUF899 family)